MKAFDPEGKGQAEKLENSSPKVLTLQEEADIISKLSMPYIGMMMQADVLGVGSFTAGNFEMVQLKLAAENGLTLMMKQLLTTGKSDVNRTDGAGNTALDFATRAGKAEMVEFLKEYGAVSGKSKKPEEYFMLMFEDSFKPVPGKTVASAFDYDTDDEEYDKRLSELVGENTDPAHPVV